MGAYGAALGATSAGVPATRWSIEPSGAFDHRLWDGEAVVYVCCTGDTHALDPAASLVFSTLLAAPNASLTSAEWLVRLIESDEASGDGSLASPEELQAFEAALVRLSHLRVVKAVEPVGH